MAITLYNNGTLPRPSHRILYSLLMVYTIGTGACHFLLAGRDRFELKMSAGKKGMPPFRLDGRLSAFG